MQVLHLEQILHNVCRKFQSCDADPDLWMKAEYRPEDKLEYYSYFLWYVYDILCIQVVSICKEYVAKHLSKGYTLLKRADSIQEQLLPWIECVPSIGTRWGILLPVLGRSNEMDDWDRMNWYKYQGISIIITFSIAEKGASGGSITYHGSTEAQDPKVDHSKFWECDWQISMRVQWKLSHLMLHNQRGSKVDLQVKVGSNHAGNKQARKLRTMFLIHMNLSLINWYSKKHLP